MNKHKSVLLEAEELVNGDRHEAYGSVEVNFGRWRDLCRASGRPNLANIEMDDIAMIMILGKIAREANTHKRDNMVDASGYCDIYEQLVEFSQEK